MPRGIISEGHKEIHKRLKWLRNFDGEVNIFKGKKYQVSLGWWKRKIQELKDFVGIGFRIRW